MNIEEHGYPAFYADVQNKKRLCIDPKKKKRKEPKKFNNKSINSELKCPMNCIKELDVRKQKSEANSVVSISEFLIPYKIDENDRRRKSRKVEDLIERYSSILYEYNSQHSNTDGGDDYILLKSEFELMMNDIKSIGLSGNYSGLMSWLINRAFKINGSNQVKTDSRINKNKALLLKVLYDVNKKSFLACFREKSVTPLC